MAGNRRYKALGTKGVNQFCISQLRTVLQQDLFLLCIQAGNFFSQYQMNVLLFIPFFALHGNLLFCQICHKGFCQHWTVVRKIWLIGNHNHRACLISFPDGRCCGVSCCAAAQNHIEVSGIVVIIVFFHVYRHKILLAHTADRTDFQRRIKDFSAYQTFHQCSASLCLLYIFLILKHTAEIIAVLISVHEIFLSWFELHPEALVYHPHAKLFQSFNQMGNRLAAPAIASECAGQLTAVSACENRGCQIPDRL